MVLARSEKFSIFEVSALPVGVRSGIVLPEDKQAGKLKVGFEARLQVRCLKVGPELHKSRAENSTKCGVLRRMNFQLNFRPFIAIFPGRGEGLRTR